jgi:Ca2+-binding RTX toxin-like protein
MLPTSTDQLLGVFDGLGSGSQSFKEPGLGGVSIYLDLNNNGVLDAGEPTQVTAVDNPTTTNIDEAGQYSFTNVQPGTYIVREVVPSGFSQTFPNSPNYHTVVVGSGQTVNNINFGNTTPSPVTLAVNPVSVAEDGTTNLVYTFTRTGNLTNALTVNYSVAGTATFNTDYSQTGAATFTSTTGTITLAAGLSTATLTIDPTADTIVEPDETVILNLASGTGYTVGTPNAATGTITNDDLPSITLAVSPSSVTEDGTSNLVYTFTRNGSTTNPLTVNYSVAGTATNGTDYASIPTSVIFAANSATVTVIVDPTADTTVEDDETVILTLASGTGYTVGTTTAVTGTITNDDTSVTTIEAFGNTKLVKDTTNKLYAQIGNNNPIAIKIGATQITTNTYPGWQTLAAETVNGANQVLWKYNDGNYLHLWSLDNNWNWQSSSGWWGLNSSEAFTQETNFQQDFNGDGIIGQPYTPIEAFGNTKLVKDTTNKLYAQIGNNNPIAIKIGATQITTNIYPGWQTLAAETVNGANQVLWKYNDGNYLHLWSLDNNWNWQSSSGWWGLNSSEAFTQETNFQQDFNGDNLIGNPLPNIASSLAVSANVPEPIIGSSNDDILTGTLDNDILVGGLGNDTITGGAGGDQFTFNNLNEGLDTITDFLSSQGDKITVSAAGFGGGLAAGVSITAAQFVLGTTALNASNRFIYNTITGGLFFDGDGTGTLAAIQIATLSSKPTLTASDIVVLV